MTSKVSLMLTLGTILQQRYRIVRLLAQGGMGAVYEARDERLGNTVAVKETFFSEEPLRKAFEREARLLAGLRHRGLPKVSDHFVEGQGQFLVMEFITGHDLSQLLKQREGAFPIEQVLLWADQMLDVLDYLHGHQPPIIHRDIKPANLKLTERGEIILLDFGLAKGFQQTQRSQVSSHDSMFAYTPGYAPVEQIQGAGTDARSDLFAVGATLYHLITGHAPSDALTRSLNVVSGEGDPLRSVQELNPRMLPGMAAVVHQALALNREDRPATAAAMRRMLLESAQRFSHPLTASSVTLPSAMSVIPSTGLETKAAVTESHRPVATASGLLERTNPTTWPVPKADTPAMPLAGQPWVWLVLSGVVATAAVLVFGIWALNFTGLFSKRSSPPTSSTEKKQPPSSESQAATPAPVTSASGRKFFINGVGMRFALIPPGSVVMGSNDYYENEKPAHPVTIPEPFLMGKYEVTQGEWKAVMGSNPSDSDHLNDANPVDSVSWEEVQEFLRFLNAKHDGYAYRLPTEAEWEYACRAGSTGKYCFGDDEREFAKYAWYQANSGGKPHPVGQKLPNRWGLFDMHGNVWEWCQDWYHRSYNGAPADGRAWEINPDNEWRTQRGGAFDFVSEDCRAAHRGWNRPALRLQNLGFRVVAVEAR